MAKPGEIVIELRATELNLSLDNLAAELEEQFQEDIKNVANAAYAQILQQAQNKLNSTRLDYIKGLRLDIIDNNSYVISLDGDLAKSIEDGMAPNANLKQQMLSSTTTVSTGSRAGQPWVRNPTGKNRYASVPFERKPFSKAPQAADMGALIRKMTAYNAEGQKQKITKIFNDPSGNPLTGNRPVAIAKDASIKNLEGLVKYQRKTKSGKIASFYVNYRTVSDNGKASWSHPGTPGLNAFPDAEKYIQEQIDIILQNYLS